MRNLIHRGNVEDAMTYHTQDLNRWHSLLMLDKSVWTRPTLWFMACRLLGLSTLVAVPVILFVDDPAALKLSRFTSISRFLSIFVGLLLGFFMSASIQRWWSCAEGFLQVFDAIRNLQMQFYALGVDEEKIDRCVRLGVLSAWILNLQLHGEALPAKERSIAFEKMWHRLATGEGLDDTFAYVEDYEMEQIKQVEDPACMLWLWVGSFIGRLAQDKDIPPMSSPTYGRLMNLAQDAHDGIRTVRSSITVQAPFIYVQMLASLVHINNIVNAISFGLTMGGTIGTNLQSYHVAIYKKDASHKEATEDAQQLLISFFFSCFGPFIYQALLEVSIAIAQPFHSVDAEVPTERLLKRLERDLHDGRLMAHSSGFHPHWKKPS